MQAPSAPLFSIVMATFNAAQWLERALASVLGQDFPHWELLVQDGGSNDATLDILDACKDSRVSIVTKPDHGVYHAWNRAVSHARGTWALFLGADDFLVKNDVLGRCAPLLRACGTDTVFAYGLLALGNGGTVSAMVDRSRHEVFRTFVEDRDMGLPFPATFVRAAFLKTHPFDSAFRIAGDFDFAAAHISLENLARLPLCVSYLEQGGLSSDPAHADLLLHERAQVMRTRVRPRLAAFARALEATSASASAEHGVV